MSSYIDRNNGAKYGIHKGSVEEQFVNYPMPQNNGNKSGVRWASLTNSNNSGLRVAGDQLFNATVSNCSSKDLTQAKHPFELNKLDKTILTIDHQQGPIGNQSCGPIALEKYWLVGSKKKFK